jgi:tRNA (guanine-N7-)-methyltransferase
MEKEILDDLLLHLDEEREESMLDWKAIFGNPDPVEIEIGIGKGRFLLDAAQRNPTINYLGIERAAKYLRIAHARGLRHQLQNVRFARVEAREFVEFFVPQESVLAYHIYFPDPWPKKRHHKRRLFNAEFMVEVERTLQVGGLLWLTTDHDDYFQVMEEVLKTSSCLVEAAVEWPQVKTNYEDKYVAAGKVINRKAVKKESAVPVQ